MIYGVVKVGRAVLLHTESGMMAVQKDYKTWQELALGIMPPGAPEDLRSQERIKEVATQVCSLLQEVQNEQRFLRELLKEGRLSCPMVGIAAAWSERRGEHP